MSWLRLTNAHDGAPIDINFHWVVSVRQTAGKTSTMLRVNGVAHSPDGSSDNLVYHVKEKPEVIWAAWCEVCNRNPPIHAATLENVVDYEVVRHPS